MSERDGSTEEGRLDPAAVAALYARHAVELRAYLLGLLRDPDLASEAMQAAFAKVMEHGQGVQERAFRTWLFRVAHNEAIDSRRRAKIETRVVRRIAWWSRSETQTRGKTPDEGITQQETVERIRQALEKLPQEQREVVRLRIYDEKTFAEIAALKDLPLGTILTRMRLATKKLAEALRGELDT